ncbi:Metallo-dependent phosphatase-like protein [Pisolithus marmoratus]|nr:Metallo-dependent phosphatase-like protein [Pisolithus marmoratus]
MTSLVSLFSRPSPLRFSKESFNARNATVYTAYDPGHPPPHPGPQWTRFICLSDTHSQTFQVPPGDVLLHSGDLSRLGTYDQLKVTMDWLRSLPHPVKIIIAGNHDLPLHESWYETQYHRCGFCTNATYPVSRVTIGQIPSHIRKLVDNENNGIVYLQDQQYTFQAKDGGRKWSVYGSPWQPWFGGWAFNYTPEEAQARVSLIQEVDILLTHGPPNTILDTTLNNQHVGCPELLAHLSKMQKPPLIHCFGHIHEAHGATVRVWDVDEATKTNSHATEAPSNHRNKQSSETIMVNAANQPIGPKAFVRGIRVPCGGPGFQPVIIDMLDSAQR